MSWRTWKVRCELQPRGTSSLPFARKRVKCRGGVAGFS